MISLAYPHQYVDRTTHNVINEQLIGDRSVGFLYNNLRENSPAMFRALTSRRMSGLLGYFHYDFSTLSRKRNGLKMFRELGADWRECVEPLTFYDSARKVFERQIRYWQVRPMARAAGTVVSPADSRILIGSFSHVSSLFIKNKFFEVRELLGLGCPWYPRFIDGEYAIFRLTPDKYHYNHLPVSGKIVDFYHVDGHYHSCNPTAQIAMASLYSKNRRVVTVIDTDVEGGSGVGLVGMVEIVALMIGDIASETMRADFRGFSKISAYQKMGVLSVIYMLGICYFVATPPQIIPDIIHGLQVLWNPGVIIGLQILWLVFFFTFGRSTVTTSTVSFDLIKENI